MPVDNTSVVNVNEISPSRAKDTKISRDIFFCPFIAVFVSSIFKIIFFKRSSWRKSGKLNNYEHFCFFVQIHAHHIIVWAI